MLLLHGNELDTHTCAYVVGGGRIPTACAARRGVLEDAKIEGTRAEYVVQAYTVRSTSYAASLLPHMPLP